MVPKTCIYSFECRNWNDIDLTLCFRNAILALGHIAVALQRADGEVDNTRAVLKFLLQWFDSNSAASSSATSFSVGDHAFAFDQGGSAAAGETIAASEAEMRPHIDLRTGGQQSGQQGPLTIDHRIIDQLGCIIISRTRIDDAYKNIMNKFKEIIKEASAMVKIGKGVGE